MKSIIRKIFSNECDEEVHQYFVRFGKGEYKRRFLISLNKGKKIKIRGSFELANDFVKFVKENKDTKFSGRVLSKDKLGGKEGKKKAGIFVYEISKSSLAGFENAYFYLLNVDDDDIVLKIKKNLPKPGKNSKKIDDKFCTLDVDEKYLNKIKEAFFWDVPECKKAQIEHELLINEIEIPSGINNSEEIRKFARRKGIIKRKINFDGKEEVKESKFSA